MTASSAIFSRLSSVSAITDLVGGPTEPRIYPVIAPENTAYPYIIFQQITGSPASTHSEPGGATMRMFQFACFAETYEGAQDLRDKLVAALDGVTLSNGDNGSLDDERDGYEEEVRLYRADADFIF